MSAPSSQSSSIGRSVTYFLLGLQALDDGGELLKDLIGLLVVFNLSGDELGEVAQGFGRVKDLFKLASQPYTEALIYTRSS